MPSIETLSSTAMFGGAVQFIKHPSPCCRCDMTFSIFVPPGEKDETFPALWWLSGLTCSAENFTTKAAAQRYAAKNKLILIAPDTSPRGEDVADDESYDLGQGAGFYVNATQEPWNAHFQMYDYIVKELPAVVAKHFPVDLSRQSIFGHSMGGHGALTIALKNPGRFKSVSAFAPIVAPTHCPWGQKALGTYLGTDQEAWKSHDAVSLIEHVEEQLELFIDQGDADNFLDEQLKPQLLVEACQKRNHPITLRMQAGYDHSYYFIASFMEDHILHHATALKS